jgi:hypothetical protein
MTAPALRIIDVIWGAIYHADRGKEKSDLRRQGDRDLLVFQGIELKSFVELGHGLETVPSCEVNKLVQLLNRAVEPHNLFDSYTRAERTIRYRTLRNEMT